MVGVWKSDNGPMVVADLQQGFCYGLVSFALVVGGLIAQVVGVVVGV